MPFSLAWFVVILLDPDNSVGGQVTLFFPDSNSNPTMQVGQWWSNVSANYKDSWPLPGWLGIPTGNHYHFSGNRIDFSLFVELV